MLENNIIDSSWNIREQCFIFEAGADINVISECIQLIDVALENSIMITLLAFIALLNVS